MHGLQSGVFTGSTWITKNPRWRLENRKWLADRHCFLWSKFQHHVSSSTSPKTWFQQLYPCFRGRGSSVALMANPHWVSKAEIDITCRQTEAAAYRAIAELDKKFRWLCPHFRAPATHWGQNLCASEETCPSPHPCSWTCLCWHHSSVLWWRHCKEPVRRAKSKKAEKT